MKCRLPRTKAGLMAALAFAVPLSLASSTVPDRFASRAERIRAVENGLIPYVPVKGLPPWNLQDRMRHHGVPGLTIAVIHNYKIDWVRSYGLADLRTQARVTPETLFSAGSISKLANAVLVMRLVQEGKLRLDAPVNDALRSWKIPDSEFSRANPPTLRMLLSHTAGTSQSAFFGYQPDQTLPTVLETLRGAPPAENNPVVVNSAPGKEFRYSGGGSLIAQLAASDATGAEYADLIEQKVFRPLGMASSTVRQPLPARFARRAAWPYSDASWFTGVPYVYPQSAAAGLYSTAGDLARLLVEIQSALAGRGRVLSAESANSMVSPQALVSEGVYVEQTGLGTFLMELKKNGARAAGRYFGHTGVNAGFTADVLGSVAGGNGVVVMANSGEAAELIREVRRSVARAYGWTEFLPAEVKPASIGTEELDRLTRRFRRGEDEVVQFRREGQYLVESINGGQGILCVPQTTDTCVLTDFGYTGEFELDAQGRAAAFKVRGLSDRMPRLADDELLPNELLRAGRLREAADAYREMKLDEWRLTSMANDLMFGRTPRLDAAGAILDLALEMYPKAAIVHRVRGVLAEKRGNAAAAGEAYRQAIALDPKDNEAARRLRKLSGGVRGTSL